MPVSPGKTRRALNELFRRGLISSEQVKNYEEMMYQAISYKSLMLAELGKTIGELYIAEEEAQHWVLHSVKLDAAHVSVPEVLLMEDDMGMEPWHGETYAGADGTEKFRQEAAEPWHHSLREKYNPDPTVTRWFMNHPSFAQKTKRILSIAYPHLARLKKSR